MRWPLHPVESVRASRFHPPFCPWPDCQAHRSPGRGFHRHGSYRKPLDPKRIPRFRCLDCRRTCSRQTFSTTYYLKRIDLLVPVAAGLAACSAHRQIARSQLCAKTSVTRMAERLGRHALLFHAFSQGSWPPIEEPVVHDHFEVFVGSQHQALGIGTAVGAESRFVYDLDPAPHRGSGRRPDRVPATPNPAPGARAYVTSIRRTFSRLVSAVPEDRALIVRVDGRDDYRRALRDSQGPTRIFLEVYPNPKRGTKGTPRSRQALLRDRAMAPVDQLHQLLRHTCSDHKRETIAFGRRVESTLGRAHLIAVWRNFIKVVSENSPVRATPAMRLGLARERWRWERILSRRLFPGRVRPSEVAQRLYAKRWTATMPALTLRQAG